MAFRRIDVDCLDEERLQDSDFEALYPHPLGDQLAEHVEQLSRQIKSLVSRLVSGRTTLLTWQR